MTSVEPAPDAGLGQPELLDLLRRVRTIAVVGASRDPLKPSHRIPSYLQSQGYRIIPVNPRGGELFGERVYPSLRELDLPVDLVDVFRPPAEAEAVAREAVAIGAPVLWFQPGTGSAAGVELASAAGLTVVSGDCLGVAHGRLGLGPGPPAH
jgi:hypothetical protein